MTEVVFTAIFVVVILGRVAPIVGALVGGVAYGFVGGGAVSADASVDAA